MTATKTDAGGHRPAVRVILVTGLSGAGRTMALKSLEDLGYEAVDNLPLSLLGRLLHPLTQPGEADHAIAVAVDFRTRDFSVAAFDATLSRLSSRPGIRCSVVFLDCDSEILARRFTETRRRHPLADDRPVADGIQLERQRLSSIAERADLRIDTTGLTGADLRRLLGGHFRLDTDPGLTVSVQSFAFRHGLPREADLVFDVRFLANPHYVEALRGQTGQHPEVGRFIAADPAYEPFMVRLTGMLELLLPLYQREGKSYLTVAVGCTGGQHRSVYVAEQLTDRLRRVHPHIHIRHRDAQEPVHDSGAGTGTKGQ